MEQGVDNLLLTQMLGDNGGYMVVGEATVANGPRPNGQIGAVVAPPLTATGTHIATCAEIGLLNGID
jgi:hypothetical protein